MRWANCLESGIMDLAPLLYVGMNEYLGKERHVQPKERY
jgi:hypothetical protein